MDATDQLVLTALHNKTSNEELQSVCPFMSKNTINKIVKERFEAGTQIHEMALLFPFVSQAIIDEILLGKINECSLDELSPIFPFVSKEINSKIFQKAYDDGTSIEELSRVLPFVNSEIIKNILNHKQDN